MRQGWLEQHFITSDFEIPSSVDPLTLWGVPGDTTGASGLQEKAIFSRHQQVRNSPKTGSSAHFLSTSIQFPFLRLSDLPLLIKLTAPKSSSGEQTLEGGWLPPKAQLRSFCAFHLQRGPRSGLPACLCRGPWSIGHPKAWPLIPFRESNEQKNNSCDI